MPIRTASRLIRCHSAPLPSPSQRPSEQEGDHPGNASGPALFARNRRDGARLLSSALIITVIALVNWAHPLGKTVALIGAGVSLFWWLRYRRLTR